MGCLEEGQPAAHQAPVSAGRPLPNSPARLWGWGAVPTGTEACRAAPPRNPGCPEATGSRWSQPAPAAAATGSPGELQPPPPSLLHLSTAFYSLGLSFHVYLGEKQAGRIWERTGCPGHFGLEWGQEAGHGGPGSRRKEGDPISPLQRRGEVQGPHREAEEPSFKSKGD